MDSVRQAVKRPKAQDVRDVESKTSWDEIKKLQDQGFAVRRKS
jgi:hypothetical protein